MKSKVFHLANDYGQINILLVSKYLDRKITSFIKDKNKYNIAKNCYTTEFRKVNYVDNYENIDFQKFDVLVLSDLNVKMNLKENDLYSFKIIIIANKENSKIEMFSRQSNAYYKKINEYFNFQYGSN